MRILLVSHELTLAGASAPLPHHAKHLQEAGHELAVWSFRDGPLGQSFRALGLQPRILGPSYEEIRAACDAAAANLDLALCNTIATWCCAEMLRNRGVPVVWFVQETCELDLWYAEKPEFSKVFRTFSELYCPSAHAAESVRLFNRSVRVIPNSIAELAVPSRPRPPLSVDLRREAPRPVTLPYFIFATIRRLYWSLRLLPKGRGPWSRAGRRYREKEQTRPQSWLDVRLQVLKQKMSFGWGSLPPWISARRLDILVPVHIDEPNLRNIGDLHFARAMRRELAAIGYRVRLVPFELWGWRSNARYVIRLKGLYDYTPRRRRGVRHVMWCISHPDMLTDGECDRYDCVLFASKRMADAFAPRLHTRTGVLLQAADEVVLARDGTPTGDPDLLFVANSRGVYRQIIRDLLPTKYNLAIYGQGWEGMPAEPFVRANGADYDEVGDLYHNAKIVLNDHWDDMRRWGIVSNRCFDVLAAGGFALSDDLPELAEVFGGTVVTYHSPEDLREKVRHYLEHPEERRALSEKGRRLVLSAHTFRHRMRQLHEVLLSLEADRGNATTKGAHGC